MRAAQAMMLGAVLQLGLLLGARPADGQSTSTERTAATVDYVSADGVYLTVGAEQGVARGDTVPVFHDRTGTEPVGRLVFTSVTRRRSVAHAVDPSLRLERGAVVYMALTPPPSTAGATSEPAARPEPGAPSLVRPTPERGGPRVSGRLSMDVDLRETHTAWTGDLSGDTRRRFATPTTRLSFNAADLPGGFSARVNLRAAYRYDELTAGPPPMSLRAYELSATKTFQALPLEITLGRFSDPYESYSAYWDGMLVRVGRRTGPGLGVVAGFEPTLYNEGLSTALPKVTGFVDYSARGSDWRYDTDASVHIIRPGSAGRLGYMGWSQQISWGPFSFNQRLRLDGGLDGTSVRLGELRLRTTLAVAGPLRVRGTYGRTRWTAYELSGVPDSTAFLPPAREEALVGFDLRDGATSLSVDGGRTREQGFADGFTISGSASQRLGGAQVTLSGQRWMQGDLRSLGVAPGIAFGAAGTRWRLGYRFYRTDAPYGSLTSHAAQAQVDVRVSGSLHLLLQGERQWGQNLRGVGLHVGLWRSF
jgi:hypothetical protein